MAMGSVRSIKPSQRSTAGSLSSMSRRSVCLVSGISLLTAQRPQLAGASEVLYVGPQHNFTSIAAAVAAAPSGSTVVIHPGRYEEQLLITSSITLQAAQQDGSVLIICNTPQPYRHCLEVAAGEAATEVVVKGVSFQHFSKSVANNYCIYAQGGALTLQGCDISSTSGVGVGVEGASVTLQRCSIHDCERHGVAAFGSLEGGSGRCELQACSIRRNKLNGVLCKDGAELVARSNSITGNGGYGLQLSYCSVVLTDNVVSSNKQGSVAVELGTVEADLEQLRQSNRLSEEVAAV